MPRYVLIVDIFGTLLAFVGFTMAFRQTAVLRMLGRNVHPVVPDREGNNDNDPLTYILRIAGVMVMVFGVVIAGMVTLFHWT